MKTSFYTSLVILTLFFIVSCNSCKDTQPAPQQPGKVDSNGLTPEINNLVPKNILDTMKGLGMPINGGENPPLIAGTYFVKPFRLVKSNRPGDVPGQAFGDYTITFKQQNNDKLAINVDYSGGGETGTGLGSYIVGDGCKFSVFVEINAMINGTNAKMINVISGSLENNGIRDFYYSNFMVNDNGDPKSVWIENGQGRVIKDEDGFSEKIDAIDGKWYDKLPPCPCTYAEAELLAAKKTTCPVGQWHLCGEISKSWGDFHHGAKYEVRWAPDGWDAPGQQCTYDADKKLITGGIGAGTADSDSPDGCSGLSSADYEHITNDVNTWKSKPCTEYLRDWPANNTNICSPNVVSPINHMLKMIGTMTCQEITVMLNVADTIAATDPALKVYLTKGTGTFTDAALKTKLIEWKAVIGCGTTAGKEACPVIDKAIANLP